MQRTRRDFLKTAGCLTIGFCLGGRPWPQPASSNPGDNASIDAWLEILADGRLRVLTGKLELGQGIRTAVAQVAAEELDMDMSQVEVTMAETGRTPNEGYTAGSNSIESSAMSVRRAAAAAREQLIRLAAEKLKVPPNDLVLSRGRISTNSGANPLTFAEILDGRQLTGSVAQQITLKPKNAYKLVGKPIPREDTAKIVKGDPIYVHDLRFPGMVHARVVRPPAYGARLLHAENVPGIIKTVINGSFLAVIAENEYQAIQAQQLLRKNATWSATPPLPKLDSEHQLADYLLSLPAKTEQVTKKGNLTQTYTPSLKARYFKPYIMHGATGPSCAIALYENNILHIWTHSQGVYPLRESLAKMLRLPVDNIHVKGVPGSGCYGHNGADDVAADAALLAMAYPNKHIRVQWMREDENAWEPYGSAMVMDVEASLDKDGKITHWKYGLWSDTHGARPGGNADNLLPARYIESPFTAKPSGFSGGAYRNATPYYSIPNQLVEAHFFDGPLRTSSLRSLGAYANLFAIESFMDELSEKAGKDPYEFRLLHLEDQRAKDVLLKLKELTTTSLQLEASSLQLSLGIAFSRYENTKSYCAVAASVSLDAKKNIHVHKMWAVIDAGEAINPDGIKNQTEGGMVQSASWTLYEEVKFNERHITSLNWNTYRVSRFPQAPATEVIVIDRPTEKPVGAGEAAQGPAAAAIANAVYRATGTRVRYLPLIKSPS
ncbi:molybdopterin-dependent oxidoreductase [Flavitalea sp. BT771]|uniref:molybdopterin cofactor-binding domain-containing protein n=1 Tax=Flavitalea sp. BT771 TaxID=3063329 RepID=UPI0026E2342C|nr:molybdopterin cofactor-binding domain-containing protein [Flavitalea sp. BT771]MDO6435634.1 molybdopterin-dependent oxidoreductase [Flavitalea sp. BT771]MDV6224534.1 molybdopterin cofactor-binding domain-containing protein [Flavitalea sp. BT771]